MKAITTKYHGPGNVRGPRISASDGEGNRVIVSYDHASSEPHRVAALALCAKMGWTGTLVEGWSEGSTYVYVWDDPRARFEVVPGAAVQS